jgi:hypothetical protein
VREQKLTPDPESTVSDFRFALRTLAGLAVLLGLGLWSLALVYRRRGRHRHVSTLLIGGAIALAGGVYLLLALP